MGGSKKAGVDEDGRQVSPETITRAFERANQIAAGNDLRVLRRQSLRLLLEVCEADAGVLFLIDANRGHLAAKAMHGIDIELVSSPPVNPAQTLVFETLRRGRPVFLEQIRAGADWLAGLEAYWPEDGHKLLAIPFSVRGRATGMALAVNPAQAPVDMVQVLANRLATEMEKADLLDVQETRNERLNALVAIFGQLGAATLNRSQIMSMIINYIPVLFNAEASSMFLVESPSNDLVLEHASDNQRVKMDKIRVPAGKGIIGQVVGTGQTIVANEIESDPRHYSDVDKTTGFVTRSILAVPLTTRQVVKGKERGSTIIRTIGGVEALNKLDGPFSDEDAQLFRSLANYTATVLQVAELWEERTGLLEGLLEALTAAIDAKDPYTQGHSRRVRDFSMAIAEELGLLPDMYDPIWIGALLHDVGKIGVSDAILRKENRLTSEEYAQIQQHPTMGKYILEQVHQLRDMLAAVFEHHERLDGSGYPAKLHGNEISISGRIVAVADVFDAMTSDRPYRAALPVNEVFRYMREVSGTLLDGECVEALIRAHKKATIQSQKERERAVTRVLGSSQA